MSSSCRFEKPCDQIEAREDALFQLTLFDEVGGEVHIKLEGKDMFVNGTLIDNNDPTIADFCFIPFLKHHFGPSDTWFLGSPILNDYYTIFDMSPGSYIQIGISIKNDEADDTFINKEMAPPPSELNEIWIVVAAVAVMALVTMAFVCCRKKKVLAEVRVTTS